MGRLFDDVRTAVSAQDAAEHYGLTVNRHRKALCPWHPDTDPSLSFKGARCKCFVCGNGGSSIDLVSRLFDLPPLAAALKLDADFSLGLDTASERPSTPSPAQAKRLADAHHRAFVRSLEAQLYLIRASLAGYTPETAENDDEFYATLSRLAEVQLTLQRLELSHPGT